MMTSSLTAPNLDHCVISRSSAAVLVVGSLAGDLVSPPRLATAGVGRTGQGARAREPPTVPGSEARSVSPTADIPNRPTLGALWSGPSQGAGAIGSSPLRSSNQAAGLTPSASASSVGRVAAPAPGRRVQEASVVNLEDESQVNADDSIDLTASGSSGVGAPPRHEHMSEEHAGLSPGSGSGSGAANGRAGHIGGEDAIDIPDSVPLDTGASDNAYAAAAENEQEEEEVL